MEQKPCWAVRGDGAERDEKEEQICPKKNKKNRVMRTQEGASMCIYAYERYSVCVCVFETVCLQV